MTVWSEVKRILRGGERTVWELGLPITFMPPSCQHFKCPPVRVDQDGLSHEDGRSGQRTSMVVPRRQSKSYSLYLDMTYSDFLLELDKFLWNVHGVEYALLRHSE